MMDDLVELDRALARFLRTMDPAAPDLALYLASLCSARLRQGHPNLNLAALSPLPDDLAPGATNDPAAILDAALSALHAASFVGQGAGAEPLVLEGERLYLAAQWRATQRIRTWISRRVAHGLASLPPEPSLRASFDALFGPVTRHDALDWQRLACAVALLQRFSIITGGPGTGKTTTVVRLLALLQRQQASGGPPGGLRIALAAPTGKAAARLTESVLAVLDQWKDKPALQALRAGIPERAQTLHRLLGVHAHDARPRHHAGNPLDLDVLVVDEASMLDMVLMDQLLAALPDSARLVLLGDKDQLASVEAGAVLGELCQRAAQGHYRPDTCERLRAICGQAPGPQWQDVQGRDLDQAVVMLRKSHRFHAQSGIGQLARAVNTADLSQLRTMITQPWPDLRWVLPPAVPSEGDDAGRLAAADNLAYLKAAGALSAQGYPALFAELQRAPGAEADPVHRNAWARDMLRRQAAFQVLCAVRQGPWGVEGLNRCLEEHLSALGHIPREAGSWYAGRPVLVLRNQPSLGLANGDIGITLPVPHPGQPGSCVLRVAFASGRPDGVHWISPARLAEVETVYALTVHKSQGSEFDRVVLVLPVQPAPVLTRELLYTGLTRARHHLTVVAPGGPESIETAVLRPTRREGAIITG